MSYQFPRIFFTQRYTLMIGLGNLWPRKAVLKIIREVLFTEWCLKCLLVPGSSWSFSSSCLMTLIWVIKVEWKSTPVIPPMPSKVHRWKTFCCCVFDEVTRRNSSDIIESSLSAACHASCDGRHCHRGGGGGEVLLVVKQNSSSSSWWDGTGCFRISKCPHSLRGHSSTPATSSGFIHTIHVVSTKYISPVVVSCLFR